MKVNALLFDTRSIQKYIFSGNQLKTNIGASYLVEKLFTDVLVKEILCDKMKLIANKTNWQQTKIIEMETNPSLPCEVAYIGGGNALILLNPQQVNKDGAKAIVSEFTKRLLICTPGLRTGVARGQIVLQEGDDAFQASLNALYRGLKQNQNVISPQVNIPYTGLTLSCDQSGETATVDIEFKNEKRYVSAEFAAKWDAAVVANQALREKFSDILKQGNIEYKFPEELERLGQVETENYIAIVHIDGNNMGKKFSSCASLQERKQMSSGVAAAVEKSFRNLVESILNEYDTYQTAESVQNKDLFALQNNILPIRPLILGGDDVTFVCMGRMAVTYAKRFVEFMRKLPIQYGQNKSLTIECCAGVAIVPTKYPFFRAYQLAEQLCAAAKEKSRTEDSSWLDYAILHGEQSPTLAQIRRQEYAGALGNLHFGPYKIGDSDYHFAIEKLLQGVEEMRKIPRNKVKEMRFVLAKGRHDMIRFKEQLEKENKENKRKIQLPQIDKFAVYEDELWHENKTPYLDMIEMMDFVLPTKEVEIDAN